MTAEPKLSVDEDGTECWFLNGQRHREDEPAVICPDGTQRWYQNGQRHRTDGPAVIWPDGEQHWYLNGKRYDFTDWLAALDSDDKTKTLLVLKWSHSRNRI